MRLRPLFSKHSLPMKGRKTFKTWLYFSFLFYLQQCAEWGDCPLGFQSQVQRYLAPFDQTQPQIILTFFLLLFSRAASLGLLLGHPQRVQARSQWQSAGRDVVIHRNKSNDRGHWWNTSSGTKFWVLPVLILHGLYLRKSCHIHSPLPTDLKMLSPQTTKLLDISTLPHNHRLKLSPYGDPSVPCILQIIL